MELRERKRKQGTNIGKVLYPVMQLPISTSAVWFPTRPPERKFIVKGHLSTNSKKVILLS
jgi:hypothetical protein